MKTLTISWTCVRLALGQIESGNNDHAIGRCGEVSRYQITGDNWKICHGGKPILEREAWRVAKRILQVRMARLSADIPPRDIYALWHRPGLYFQAGGHFALLPEKVRKRCIRFKNLYNEACRKQHSNGR